ncbi:hypothetical protein [Micromonospora violae]|uniref:hypothetical protein n=1 Tax=Micromonospora violae TaxID=1278207 RepID=UPI00340EDE6F
MPRIVRRAVGLVLLLAGVLIGTYGAQMFAIAVGLAGSGGTLTVAACRVDGHPCPSLWPRCLVRMAWRLGRGPDRFHADEGALTDERSPWRLMGITGHRSAEGCSEEDMSCCEGRPLSGPLCSFGRQVEPAIP